MFPLTKWHVLWLTGAALLGTAILVPVWLRHASSPQGPVTLTGAPPPPPAQKVAGIAVPVEGPIYVHVTGQVSRPGLYRLPPGSRVMDAVTGAGGATAEANLDALNLATPLRDGQKLLVPRLGEAPPPAGPGYLEDSPAPTPEPVLVRADPPPASSDPLPESGQELPAAQPGAPPAFADAGYNDSSIPAEADASRPAPSGKLRRPGDGVVALNAAGSAQLQRLPGVGPATAARILEYRSAHGGFKTVDELMEVKGIGPKKLAKMRPFIVLNEGGGR